MSDETKTLAGFWVMLALIFISVLFLLRMADNKIHKLENKIKAAKTYCIGKENRLDFCEDLFK
jgi:hypothetical protein